MATSSAPPPEFGTSLYELAWVYVRLNDTTRATRALETLAIVDPSNTYLADGTLLRADLMLRGGEFKKALELYEGVRREYDPMREKVDAFLKSTVEPRLLRQALQQRGHRGHRRRRPAAPRRHPVGPRGARRPRRLRPPRRPQPEPRAAPPVPGMIVKLRSVLAASSASRPSRAQGRRRALLLLINRITQSRVVLATGLDDAEPGEVSGELAVVRQERRALQQRIKALPLNDGDLANHDAAAERQWNRVSQALQQLQLQVGPDPGHLQQPQEPAQPAQ